MLGQAQAALTDHGCLSCLEDRAGTRTGQRLSCQEQINHALTRLSESSVVCAGGRGEAGCVPGTQWAYGSGGRPGDGVCWSTDTSSRRRALEAYRLVAVAV